MMLRAWSLLGLLCLLALAHIRSAAAENVTLCWGDGSSGQLGDGDGQGDLQQAGSSPHNSSVPVEVLGGHSLAAVCTGEKHSCGVEPSGQAWCWGRNNHGQLGDGTNTSSTMPIDVAGGHTFRSITCGSWHTCSLDNKGKAWCWGSNNDGLMGMGKVDSLVPVEAAPGRTFTALSAGELHNCGIDQLGKTYCWGDGYEGQLGGGIQGGDAHSATPVEVVGGHTFRSITSGYEHTCALDEAGQAWCWGAGSFGQLGDSGNTSQPSPVPVSGGLTFTAIAAGHGRTCAITQAGSMRCWGRPMVNGQAMNAYVPEEVDGNHTFVAVSAGDGNACGLDTSGDVWCFGNNADGQLGNGNTTDSATPVKVAGGHTFLSLGQLNAWSDHNCAIASSQAGPGDSSSSSSTPVGAIVGGIVGAVVILAVLAFFALRPGKGWLRHKPTRTGTVSVKGSLAVSHAAGAPLVNLNDEAAPTEPVVAPLSNVTAAGWAGSTQLVQQPLPNSYVSSAGLAGGSLAAAAQGSALTGSHSSSAYSATSDPVLAFVSSYVGSQPATALHQQPTALTTGDSTGGSGAFELRTDARVWEVQWPELTILRAVGHGSFGSVYLAEWNQIPVAVKVLVGKEDINRGQLELPERVLRELQAEAAVMSHMRHPNIVQFMGLVAVPPAIITEYCSRGSLYSCLAAAGQQPAAAGQLTWRRRLGMAVDAGAGLLYLHRRSIIHRDVKSPNMLVDEHWRVKVADFNLSKLLEGARPESSLTSAAATNPIWLAPEVLEGGSATAASDVYSFSMVLFELLTWRLPWTFANMTPFKVGATVRQGGRPEVPPRQALPGADTAGWAGLDAYLQLMRDCWAQRPADRPSFDEVVGRLRRLLDDTAGS